MSDVSAKATPFGALERTLAWRYLRARREHGGASFISILSFIAITLAVMMLIVTMSIMTGFRATLLDALLGGQPHVRVLVDGYSDTEADLIRMDIEKVPGIKSVSPMIEQTVLVTGLGGASTGGLVRALVVEDMDTMEFLEDGGQAALEAGFGEGKNGGNVVMLGKYLAQDLRVTAGDTVRITAPQTTSTAFGRAPRSKNYVVGEVFQTGSVELDKIYIFMPMQQAQLLFNYKGRYEMLDVRLNNPNAVEAAQEGIEEATGNAVYTYSWKQERAAYLNALNIERGMVRLILMAMVALGALNIIVGVVMLVKNKRSDVAILRTMGLTRGGVMRVFFLIGTLLGVLGAIFGVFLGVMIVMNIGVVEAIMNVFVPGQAFDAETYGLEGLPAVLDWHEVIMTALLAIGLSMLVSILPAWWAARQDPVEALRSE